MSKYPSVKDPSLVGTYPAVVGGGGGYVWDDVLEYRVWCHPHDGAPDTENGDDYYYVFETYEEAQKFSLESAGAEAEPGQFIHKKEQRLTEWSPEFLSRPRRSENTIPDFLAPNAPSNRLDIIRGLA
jgi:hypothetical protein